MNYYLGIDNGLTATKAAVFDENGTRISIAEKKTQYTGDEIPTDLLWENTSACIREAVSAVDPENIKAVSVSGHGNGLYTVDENLTPAYFAITSMTQRTADYVIESDEISALTYQNVWAGQPALILRWFKDHRPDVYEKIHRFMFCKDFIKMKLTDRVVSEFTDMSAGGLLNIHTGKVEKRIFEIFGIEEMYDKSPALSDSPSVMGYVTEKAAKETGLSVGTPVSGGAFDVVSCVLGSHATKAYSIISGTWGINSAVTDTAVRNKEILQCCAFADSGRYICIDSAPTSAVNLEWFLSNVLDGMSPKDADISVNNAKDSNIVYLPYIHGSADGLTGIFVGLTAETTKAEMLKAIFEGVCFEHKMRLDKIKNTVKNISEIILAGGGSNSAVWSQMFADVLEMPVRVNKEKQTGLLGAAINAMVGAGAYADINAAVSATVIPDKLYLPKKSYREKYERYKKIFFNMKGLN